ncbi:MAG TPA: glycogen debranching enzyme N-terminal domain-containing protein, partial [Nitrospira sp.]|nr:glycogen debranching enzyme N-terminal domain-containing protein [Nitrospira sp.]
MEIDRTDCQNLDRALSLEWLETNGRGGFSSGTVAGANTRRYHALLLTARKPPTERFVLVNQLEEWLDWDGVLFPLSTNCYRGAVYPNGYQSCTGFSTDPWPTWTFEYRGAIVQRELFNVRGRDLVIIRWTFRGEKKQRATLHIKPKLSGRDYHSTHHENTSLSTDASIVEGIVTWQMYSDVPLVRAFHSGRYRHEP